MEILYGTTNPAKWSAMCGQLEGLGLEIRSLREFERVPEVREAGKDPLENARIKARTYWQAYHMPVFSCDSGLYIREIPEELQPGVHVRRRGEYSMSDEEMTAYYAGLAKKYGRLTARYQNAICLVLDETHVYEEMSPELTSENGRPTIPPGRRTRTHTRAFWRPFRKKTTWLICWTSFSTAAPRNRTSGSQNTPLNLRP